MCYNLGDTYCARCWVEIKTKQSSGLYSKSEQPVNEVRVPQALPEYYIKYCQFENAKSDYLNRLSIKLSFKPSTPKGMSFYKIKEAF